jgi:hypothetical protein
VERIEYGIQNEQGSVECLMESCKWEINKKDAKKLTNSAQKMTNLSFEVIISKQGNSIAMFVVLLVQ